MDESMSSDPVLFSTTWEWTGTAVAPKIGMASDPVVRSAESLATFRVNLSPPLLDEIAPATGIAFRPELDLFYPIRPE